MQSDKKAGVKKSTEERKRTRAGKAQTAEFQNNMKQDYTQIDPVVKEAVAILQRAAPLSLSTGLGRCLHDVNAGWNTENHSLLIRQLITVNHLAIQRKYLNPGKV